MPECTHPLLPEPEMVHGRSRSSPDALSDQPTHHVCAHAPKSDHAELHSCVYFLFSLIYCLLNPDARPFHAGPDTFVELQVMDDS